MKLFIILSRFPYPLEKGDKLRAYHQIKELHSLGYEIHLCCLSDREVSDTSMEEIEKYCKSVQVYQLNTLVTFWNTLMQFFTNKPFQVGYFYHRHIARKIHSQIDEINPDHIYCQLIRTAEYVKNIHNIPKTLDYMDALSKGMYRRALISKGLKKRAFKMEGKRLAEYENRIFDYFNYHTIISEQDRDLINHPDANKIMVIENGISEDFFERGGKGKLNFDLVFVGNMNYAPNIECAEYIVNEILPLLAEDTTVALCGASPHQRIIALGANEKVTISGWVEDITEAYLSGKVFVAPLFIGTGLQNKLLEAMALEIPCITTPLANNALGAKPDEEILVATNPKEFAEGINRLLGDEQYSFQIASSGKNFVKENFSWQRSVLKLHLAIFNSKE